MKFHKHGLVLSYKVFKNLWILHSDWLLPQILQTISKMLKNPVEVRLSFDWFTLNLLKTPWPLKVDSDWLITEKTKISLQLMLDSDWLIANFLKSPWLDWINFISARFNSKSILIFFNVKINWVRNLLFVFNFFHFLRLFNFSFLNILNLQFFLFLLIEMPSLNRNERIACLECGREYTRLHASRPWKHCGVLKCSNCNFYTYSSEELTNQIKKKYCQHRVVLCAQQSQKTTPRGGKIDIFLI